jgi:crotonobetainyl-CoA:carnitine CoA-transferase CaiB-like acyl-CoA transferase
MDVTNGIMGASALMTALVQRELTGEGAWLDVSEMEAPVHSLIAEHLLEFTANGSCTLPLGNRSAEHAPQGCYPCRGEDAWVVLSVKSEAQWAAFCEATGRAEWRTDPRFATVDGRRKHHDELDGLIGEWTVGREDREVVTILQGAGIAAGAVLDVAALARDPHLAEREFFRDSCIADRPGRYPGVPFRFSGGGGESVAPGPELAEANHYVVTGILGRPESDVRVPGDDEVGTDFDV